MSPPGPAETPSLVKRIDDAVHGLERRAVAGTLGVMVVLVALDVLYRRLSAPESKIGSLLRRIVSWFVTPSPDLARTLDGPVANVVVVLVLFGLTLFGVRTVRGAEARLSRGGELALAAALTAAMVGLAALALYVPSNVYLAVLSVVVAAVLAAVRLRAGAPTAKRDAAIVGAGGVASAAVLLAVVPDGYSWSKEASMIALLWNGLLGASMCAYQGRHVELDFGPKAVPERLRPAFLAAGAIVLAALLGAFTWISVIYVFSPDRGLLASGAVFEATRIPDWVAGAAIPLAFGIMGLRAARSAFTRVRAEGRAAWRPLLVAVLGTLAVIACFWVVRLLTTGEETTGAWGWLALSALCVFLLVIGEPLYLLLGVATAGSFFLWEAGYGSTADLLDFPERIRGLADTQALLAIPFFMLAGAIMSSGQSAGRIIAFARAALGWLPGGLAIAGVFGCVIFGAISGSSAATLAAMGPPMAPELTKRGYDEDFSIGLVTSAGSLGILLPPSIPMIIYCIFHTSYPIEVEKLFVAGVGPALVIAAVLGLYGSVTALRRKIPRTPFSARELRVTFAAAFWALGLPAIILGGIYTGIFTAIEASSVSVVYAVLVEVYFHRGLRWRDLPKVLAETSTLLGSFVVIVVMAMCLAEFIEVTGVARLATDWIASMDLPAWQFLIAANILLLIAGGPLDMMSAIMILVPVLGPMAMRLGIDPIHFAIVFIVNMEIGYLTPPVALNLFLGSAMFKKSFRYMAYVCLPFVFVMTAGLIGITYVPELTLAPVRWALGGPAAAAPPPDGPAIGAVEPAQRGAAPGVGTDRGADRTAASSPGRVQSLEEMMREAEAEATRGEPRDGPTVAPPDGGVVHPFDRPEAGARRAESRPLRPVRPRGRASRAPGRPPRVVGRRYRRWQLPERLMG